MRTTATAGVGARYPGYATSSRRCEKRGNSASIFNCTRAVRKLTPSSSRSTYGSATSIPAMLSRAAIFGNCAANSPAIWRKYRSSRS